ncbi:PTS lactose transporter subunit IIB [Amycolatopsis pigmentata]|uniref:PTS lactose transporter subunit IIB n=1 Tax=Amycolatopsis pigmentata TaxID=450801 RepID=A0ABW5G164_9PSEU
MSTIDAAAIKRIVIACDAGMGSSVMLAAQLSSALRKYEVSVRHAPVNKIPPDADLVMCQEALVARARSAVPGTAVLGFRMFLGDPLFDQLEKAIKNGTRIEY